MLGSVDGEWAHEGLLENMAQRSKSERRTASQEGVQPAVLAPRAALPRTTMILFALAACAVCLGYTLYTNEVWEDSLITLRHSENLLKGNGLTFNPGSRVHGFTSPINVLLLALCHLLTGQSSYTATCWLYRVFSIAAFAVSGVLMLKAVDETPPRWSIATWFLGVVYIFDVKNVAFSINGMETAFMLLAVAWAVYLMSRADTDQWLWRGLCWAFLMWCRPDSCVYIATFALAELLFLSALRRATFVSLVKSAVVCGILYGPWILWAWSYYGSPIPHTIIAKADIEQGLLGKLLFTLDNCLMTLISVGAQVFRPIYYGDTPGWWLEGTSERLISGLTKFVGITALLYVFFPTKDRFGRAMSCSFGLLSLYLGYMPFVYPWYFPGVMVPGAIAFIRAATSIALAGEPVAAYLHVRRPKFLVHAAFVLLGGCAIAAFLMASVEERIRQSEVETGNRALIGAWLKEHGKPTDTVYLEPLGYIGYFCEMQMRDFPGLVAPEVVKIRKRLANKETTMGDAKYRVLEELKPDWVVLRTLEMQQLAALPMFEEFKKNYALVKKFDVFDNLARYSFLPGRRSLEFDARFGVFRRRPSPGAPAPVN
jgi:hypothetical protein